MIESKDIPSDAPRPRLCHIVKRDDFNGYGFNLHAQKNKPGQFIGTVDENSPAEKAGLLEGDRILEVNGVNIANENHKQVVERIKAVVNETSLLVVDRVADDYYRKLDIVISGDMDIVLKQSSLGPIHSEPDLKQLKIEEQPEEVEEEVVVHPVEVCVHEEDEDSGRKLSEKSSSSSGKDSGFDLSVEEKPAPLEDSIPKDKPLLEETHVDQSDEHTETVVEVKNVDEVVVPPVVDENSVEAKDELPHAEEVKFPEKEVVVDDTPPETESRANETQKLATSTGSASSSSPRSTPSPKSHEHRVNDPPSYREQPRHDDDFDGLKLNLNMSAKEMREMIGAKKKRDPRKDSRMDFKKKYEIIQTL